MEPSTSLEDSNSNFSFTRMPDDSKSGVQQPVYRFERKKSSVGSVMHQGLEKIKEAISENSSFVLEHTTQDVTNSLNEHRIENSSAHSLDSFMDKSTQDQEVRKKIAEIYSLQKVADYPKAEGYSKENKSAALYRMKANDLAAKLGKEAPLVKRYLVIAQAYQDLAHAFILENSSPLADYKKVIEYGKAALWCCLPGKEKLRDFYDRMGSDLVHFLHNIKGVRDKEYLEWSHDLQTIDDFQTKAVTAASTDKWSEVDRLIGKINEWQHFIILKKKESDAVLERPDGEKSDDFWDHHSTLSSLTEDDKHPSNNQLLGDEIIDSDNEEDYHDASTG